MSYNISILKFLCKIFLIFWYCRFSFNILCCFSIKHFWPKKRILLTKNHKKLPKNHKKLPKNAKSPLFWVTPFFEGSGGPRGSCNGIFFTNICPKTYSRNWGHCTKMFWWNLKWRGLVMKLGNLNSRPRGGLKPRFFSIHSLEDHVLISRYNSYADPLVQIMCWSFSTDHMMILW